jgi:hypothetical protein
VLFLPGIVPARRRQCINPSLAVNDAQAPGITLEEHAIVTLVSRHGPRRASGTAGEEQRSRDTVTAKLPCLDDRHDFRFRRHSPVPAARARMPALVPCMDVQRERSHFFIISSTDLERKVVRPIQQTVFRIETSLTNLRAAVE